MDERNTGEAARKAEDGPAPDAPARSVQIASRGIDTSRQAANFISAAISDVMSGAIKPAVGNTAFNGMGKLLKLVELEHKYGKPGHGPTGLSLTLADAGGDPGAEQQPAPPDPLAVEREDLLRRLAEIDAKRAGR